jgi:dTDP-glucose 4,6-dehydratase
LAARGGAIGSAPHKDSRLAGRRILVTGGAGFLGSHFVRRALRRGAEVVNVDALTYAGDLRRLQDVDGSRYDFIRLRIESGREVGSLMRDVGPRFVVHFAAESHVTRSELTPDDFYQANVEGTRTLLEWSLRADVDLFLYISTDEVYGSIPEGEHAESDRLTAVRGRANHYARSKALADELVRSYADRLPSIVVRPTNVFGSYQLPEKAVARWITRGLCDMDLPVWGDGLHVRQWLYVDDLMDALDILLERGEIGESYNVSPNLGHDLPNVLVASWLARRLGMDEDRVERFSYDRPNHDRRYALNSDKIRSLGWESGDLWEQLGETVDWYRASRDWWQPHLDRAEAFYRTLS